MDYIFIWNIGRKGYRFRIPGGNVNSINPDSLGTLTVELKFGPTATTRTLNRVNGYDLALDSDGTFVAAFPSVEYYDHYITSRETVCVDLGTDFENYARQEVVCRFDRRQRRLSNQDTIQRNLSVVLHNLGIVVPSENIELYVSSDPFDFVKVSLTNLSMTDKMLLKDYGIKVENTIIL